MYKYGGVRIKNIYVVNVNEYYTVKLLPKGTFKRNIEKVKIKGFAPDPLFLPLLVPYWPEEINKIPDSKNCQSGTGGGRNKGRGANP